MGISELQVIYSPHYEGTNNLIKWQFRLKEWFVECTPLNSHWLILKNGGTDFHYCWFVDSM